MQKFKKMLALVCAVVMVFGLAACGGDDAKGGAEQGGAVQNEQQVQGPLAWQSFDETPGLTLAVDEQNGDAVLQIPQFVGEDDAVIAEFNESLMALEQAWRPYMNGEADKQCVVRAYPLEDEGFINLVVTAATLPGDDTEGQLTSYVYDKTLGSKATSDFALAYAGITEDTIAVALDEYMESISTEEVKKKWNSFNISGFVILEEGDVVFFVDTMMKSEDERWSQQMVYADGEIIGSFEELYCPIHGAGQPTE